MQIVAEQGQVIVFAPHRLGHFPGDFRIKHDQWFRPRVGLGNYPLYLAINAVKYFFKSGITITGQKVEILQSFGNCQVEFTIGCFCIVDVKQILAAEFFAEISDGLQGPVICCQHRFETTKKTSQVALPADMCPVKETLEPIQPGISPEFGKRCHKQPLGFRVLSFPELFLWKISDP